TEGTEKTFNRSERRKRRQSNIGSQFQIRHSKQDCHRFALVFFGAHHFPLLTQFPPVQKPSVISVSVWYTKKRTVKMDLNLEHHVHARTNCDCVVHRRDFLRVAAATGAAAGFMSWTDGICLS